MKPSNTLNKFLRSPISNNDTSRLGYTSTKQGESSKSVEERNNKGENSKHTCLNYRKEGHTANVYRRKIANQNVRPKNMIHFHKCNKKGHKAHECNTRTMYTQRFEGYCYNCWKYGH